MSNKSRVDLEDLRIRERPPRGGGRGLLVLLLLLVAGGAFAAGWLLGPLAAGPTGGAVAVRTAVVTAGGPSRNREEGGFSEGGWVEVPSYHPIMVSALIPGRVEELLVLEGSPVAKGQTIARLYDRDLRDDLRRAEAAAARAKARLDLVTRGYREEEVAKQVAVAERLAEEAALAARIHERTKHLVPSGAASRETLERDAAARIAAEKRHAAAMEELRRLRAGFRSEEIEEARAALAEAEAARDLARSRLGYAEVKSPAAGVVLERFVTPGTWLRKEDPRIVSLYDPGDLQVRVDIRQENAGRLRVGQKAFVTTDAAPDRSFESVVLRIEPLADFKKNTVQAKLKILSPDGSLHPEMICRVRFQEPEEKKPAAARRSTVPLSALVTEGGRHFVFTVREGRARRTEVRLGGTRGGRVEIEKGLSVGERVVLDPAGLRDGDRVREIER